MKGFILAAIFIGTAFYAVSASGYGSLHRSPYSNRGGSYNGAAQQYSGYGRYSSYRRYGNYNGRYNYRYRRYCSKLSAPANGDIKLTGTYTGSKAIYLCDAGFKLVGNRVRKCQSNRKWSGTSPSCRRVDCGTLNSISNGRVSVNPNTLFESTATYTCNTGFELVGSSTRTCQANRSWSGSEPSCARVDCGSLDSINNGQVRIRPNTLFESIATYSCNAGFELNGQQTRTCRADRNWSGSEPSCIRVDCGPLNSIIYGEVTVRPNTLFESIATYACNAGFELVGSSTRTCQADRNWSGREPSCARVDCGPLGSIDNGKVRIRPNTLFESIATYSCDTGFELLGQQTRTCLTNSRWSGRQPSCAPIDCGYLDAPDNGFVRFTSGTTFGSTATFSCKIGFLLFGSIERVCQANKEWSGTRTSCQKVKCPELIAPSYGTFYASGNHPGDYATFSCNYGYSLIGKGRIVCLDTGVWSHSGELPRCQKDYYPRESEKYDGPIIHDYDYKHNVDYLGHNDKDQHYYNDHDYNN